MPFGNYQRDFKTKGKKTKKEKIPPALVPKPVTDKHIAQVAKKAIRIRQEEKSLFYGKNSVVPMGTEFISPITAGVNQNLFRVNQVDQGDASNQREGLEIEAVKLQLRMRTWFSQTPSLTSATQTSWQMRFRVLVFWYNQSDNNVLSDTEYPKFGELFEYNGGLLIPSSAVDGIYNHTFKQNFHILFDKVYRVSNQEMLVHTLSKDIYLKNKKVKYTTSSVSATTPIANALFILICSDNPVGADPNSNQIVKIDLSYNFVFREL